LNDTLITADPGVAATSLWLVAEGGYAAFRAALPPAQAAWLEATGFQPEKARLALLPGSDGRLAGVVAGLGASLEAAHLGMWDAAAIPERLPAGCYALATPLPPATATRFALGWLVGQYRFQRLRSNPKPPGAAQLVLPAGADERVARASAASLGLARDLVNAPANELGPEELVAIARALATEFGGTSSVCEGEELRRHYPLVHAVGAGSSRAPRLVSCHWPRPGAPRVTLVGKGVCFDTGGLDLKPSAGMLLMKKDMGGAACALALARLLLALAAPIELRLLVPAVENSVSGSAYRPGDVWRSRKGLTVEIGNTDAEGRLVLADALADADAGRPDLLIDLATLTGAARTALGPEVPAVFSPDAALAEQARRAGEAEGDPLWPLPLWAGYEDELASRVADLNNVAAGPFAGAIMGALFLKRFVTATPAWLHVDLYAWNPKERPGRPVGAEAQAVRALYALVRERFG
jgi:leucyl aminopeptidase